MHLVLSTPAILDAMEYQVPQFIEVESKVVGTLTLRQFIYVAGGGGMCVIFFIYLPLLFAILLSLPVAGFAVALSFFRMNGKPFIEVMVAAFNYYTRTKLFLWKHEDMSVKERNTLNAAAASAAATDAPREAAKLTRGKLSELAWSLDVQQPS